MTEELQTCPVCKKPINECSRQQEYLLIPGELDTIDCLKKEIDAFRTNKFEDENEIIVEQRKEINELKNILRDADSHVANGYRYLKKKIKESLSTEEGK